MLYILHDFNSPKFPDFWFYCHPHSKEVASLHLGGFQIGISFHLFFSPDITFSWVGSCGKERTSKMDPKTPKSIEVGKKDTYQRWGSRAVNVYRAKGWGNGCEKSLGRDVTVS